ncbi:hypothetical protein AAKU52_002659 [Pedobacter sp. CG_S7]|uniref:hypothetical protein n=1 Tax=Pedobacter sp. CG_S7 TaxID=3143930 RepID=UPI003390B7C8
MKNLLFKYKFNNFYFLLLGILLMVSCQNEPNYKAVRQEVMDLHDKIMVDGERAIKNKMILDTLSKSKLKQLKQLHPEIDTLQEKVQIVKLVEKLSQADEMMMDWMHEFQADIEGKSNAQAVTYFKGEMVKVANLDHFYEELLKESNAYLKKFNLNSVEVEKEVPHNHSKHL